MVIEPLLGWRAVQVTERRTAVDFAEVVRWLVEEVHAEAEKVVLVMDNLNTHKVACLYEAFPPEQARRIAEKLEIHYTPKHGSWLNMAEIELSVLARQCLDRRIESREELEREVAAWEEQRNERRRRCAGGSRPPTPGSSWRSCIRCSSTPILIDFRSRRTYQKSCDSRRVRLNP